MPPNGSGEGVRVWRSSTVDSSAPEYARSEPTRAAKPSGALTTTRPDA